MRFLGLAIAAMLLLGQTTAFGEGLLLEEPPATSFTVTGWTFLVLTLVMGGYAQEAITASESALASAKSSYTSYQGAGSSSDAALYRAEAAGFLATAQTEEERANLGMFLTVAFGLTSYYSFFPNHSPNTSIIVKPGGVALLYRF